MLRKWDVAEKYLEPYQESMMALFAEIVNTTVTYFHKKASSQMFDKVLMRLCVYEVPSGSLTNLLGKTALPFSGLSTFGSFEILPMMLQSNFSPCKFQAKNNIVFQQLIIFYYEIPAGLKEINNLTKKWTKICYTT